MRKEYWFSEKLASQYFFSDGDKFFAFHTHSAQNIQTNEATKISGETFHIRSF